jgi:hypothetical protein
MQRLSPRLLVSRGKVATRTVVVAEEDVVDKAAKDNLASRISNLETLMHP